MICEICHNKDSEGRFCSVCIAKLTEIMSKAASKPSPAKPKPLVPLRIDETTHYRVQLNGFCCYVDIRYCPNMDDAPNYALNPAHCEPWYPTMEVSPLQPNIPFVRAVTHNAFADWLRQR